jgi:membrane-bound metal-dependent hydrolase YbcI (DUF457 family)
MDGWAHAGTGMALGTLGGLALRQGLPHSLLDGFVVGGAALLPDADHKNAAISHTLGVVTYAATSLLGKVSGGHRHFLHWFAGVATVTALAAIPAFDHATAVKAAAIIVLGICIMAALKVTRLARLLNWKWRATGVLAAGMGLAAAAVLGEGSMLWVLVACGMTLHILEDLTTGNGRWLAAHMFWPVPGLLAHRRAKTQQARAAEVHAVRRRAARAGTGPQV